MRRHRSPIQGAHQLLWLPAKSGRKAPAALSVRPSQDACGLMLHDGDDMPAETSISSDKIRILLLEGVNDSGMDLIASSGFRNVERLAKALDGEALRAAVERVDLVGIRSRTQ